MISDSLDVVSGFFSGGGSFLEFDLRGHCIIDLRGSNLMQMYVNFEGLS